MTTSDGQLELPLRDPDHVKQKIVYDYRGAEIVTYKYLYGFAYYVKLECGQHDESQFFNSREQAYEHAKCWITQASHQA